MCSVHFPVHKLNELKAEPVCCCLATILHLCYYIYELWNKVEANVLLNSYIISLMFNA